MQNKITIVFISDTHCYLGNIVNKLPKADLLIHCGDALNRGSIEEFIRFCNTLNNIHKNYHTIFFIPGNHDKILQKEEGLCKEIFKEKVPNGHVLIDEEFIYKGLKIYGSPWTPEFGFGWAYQLTKENIKQIHDKIPFDVDILINHGMPYGIMDKVELLFGDEIDHHVGDKILSNKIDKIKPSIFAGGHLHDGHGFVKTKNTLYLNASICNEQYNPINCPWIVEIDTKTKEIKILN